jgi:hypothetical protein
MNEKTNRGHMRQRKRDLKKEEKINEKRSEPRLLDLVD